MITFLKRCWQKWWFRGLTWIAVFGVTLFVLFRQWVIWKGARRWQAAQAMLAKAGESLDVHQAGRDPVPDAQNFCAIPLLKNLSLDKGPEGEAAEANRKRLEALSLPTRSRAGARPDIMSKPNVGVPIDLKALADWMRREKSLPVPSDSGNPARDVMTGLAKHDEIVAELVAGLSRPEGQWTPAWRTRELPRPNFSLPIPHMGPLGGTMQFLCLRSAAACQAEDAKKAHESLLILLRLSRASLDEPMLISNLVGVTGLAIAHTATWDLCRTRVGTAENFRLLELEWRRLDIRDSMLRSFRAEMLGSADTMQWLKGARGSDTLAMLEVTGGSGNANMGLLTYLIPPGWYDMNAAAIVELHHEYIITPLRDQGLTAALKRQPALESLLKHQQTQALLHLDTIFARLVMAASTKMIAKAAYTQELANQAVIACALARHYAVHKSYPGTLAGLDLEGRPLPLDLFTGKPPGYRKTSNGRYMIWNAGTDAEDDGGRRMLDVERPEKTRFHEPGYTGDWVWDYPEK
jgi:hypothetical protein